MDDNQRIILNTADSVFLVQLQHILYCKSNNSYTTFYLTNHEPIIVSRNIKEYENQLHKSQFFRTHQSYLVNLLHIKSIEKQNDFSILLSDNSRIPTSTRKRKMLLHFLQNE